MTRTTPTGRDHPITGLYGVRIRVLGAELQATDAVVFGALLLFMILIPVFHARIVDPWATLARTAFWAAAYTGSVYLLPRLRNRVLRFCVRTGAVQILFYELFLICQRLQLIWVRHWQDGVVLGWERAVFGVQPTVWLQRFISPPLTEWLMFTYVIYAVIYPGLGALIYFKRGERPLEDYLLTLALANLACLIGFMLFPVAGPLNYMAGAYSVPLKGGPFTAWGEYIRTHIHEVGSNLPSPHAAVATVMWGMAHRYVRPAFYALAPIILSLYVSTFFLRYHYLSDTVFGILTALLVIILVPAFLRAWNGAARRGRKTRERRAGLSPV
jgi:membrane-associated phospholipid phosphatase